MTNLHDAIRKASNKAENKAGMSTWPEAFIASLRQSGYWIAPVTPSQQMCQEGQWKASEWPKFPLRISPIYAAMRDAYIKESGQ